jgi:hypothetical protein
MTLSILEELILIYPNDKWNWKQLTMNPNVSFEFIKNNKNLPWDYNYISCNLSITEDIVLNNTDINWNYKYIYSNKNFSFKFIYDYFIKNNIHIDWYKLSSNPSINISDILQYPNLPWDTDGLSTNPSISINYILNEGKTKKWNLYLLSSNSCITEIDIYKNKLNWIYTSLSSNHNLPIKYVSDNITKDWNYYNLSSNPNITMNDIKKYPYINWDSIGLSLNSNLYLDFILDNLDIKWNFNLILKNRNFTMDILIDNPIYFNLTSDSISLNPNITYDYIKKYKRYINFNNLSNNNFNSI